MHARELHEKPVYAEKVRTVRHEVALATAKLDRVITLTSWSSSSKGRTHPSTIASSRNEFLTSPELTLMLKGREERSDTEESELDQEVLVAPFGSRGGGLRMKIVWVTWKENTAMGRGYHRIG